MTSSKQEKVGLFGGTFDPIHFGHLQMAKELMQRKNLSEVWFCPAKINPQKIDDHPVSIKHRLRMVELAIEEESKFILLPIEAHRQGPSYTIDTVRELLSREQARPTPRQIYLMISDEVLQGFSSWKEVEEIVRHIPLLIGSRWSDSKKRPTIQGSRIIQEAVEKGWCPTQPFKASSTEIREKLKNGENCQDLVPKKVLDYIYLNSLYC